MLASGKGQLWEIVSEATSGKLPLSLIPTFIVRTPGFQAANPK